MKTSVHNSRTSPLRIAGAYLVFGVLWILLSDHLVDLAGLVGADVRRIQSAKGIIFVILSATLIYGLVMRELRKVRRTASMLAAVAEGTTDAVFVKDEQGRYVLINSSGAGFMGKRPEEIIGRDDRAFFPPASAQIIRENDRKVIETGRTVTEIERLDAAGVQRVFQATKAPYRDEQGDIIGMIGISRDITVQADAEQAVRNNERRFRALFERSSDATLITGPDGRIVEANEAACTMFARPRELLMNMLFKDLLIADQHRSVEPAIHRLLEHGSCASEWTFQRPDGSTCIGDERASVLPDGRFLLCIRDITARKQVEQAILHSRSMLQTFVESTPAAIAMLDRDLRYIAVSKRWKQDYRLQERELVGVHHYDVFPEIRQMPHWQAIHRRCLAGAVERCEEDHFIRADGNEEWVRWEIRPWMDEAGAVGGIIMFTEVITQRKREAIALLESEQRFRTIVQTTSEWIWAMDAQGRHTFSNPAVTAILGYVPDEIVGHHAAEFIHPEDMAEIGRWLPRIMAQKRGWSGVVIRWRDKQGNYRWLESNASPILSAEGELQGFLGADRDITERRQAEEALRDTEEQLRQARKMQAIGQLAGGIAHDFNNLLTVINGYCDLLRGQTAPDDPRLPLLCGIADAGERAASLTLQLLAFSRRQMLEPRLVDLNQSVREIQGMLSRMIGHDIELRTDLADDLLTVRVDPGQIGQVIMNLALNARDAMPDGGQLTFATRNVTFDANMAVRHATAKPGPYVVLTVSDTGVGMDEQTKSRLFEPFFTTKDVGEGTGLGLAVVHGIVTQSGGFIDITSSPGKGSTFSIHLPASSEPAAQPVVRQETDVVEGDETLLLVEDDLSVRDFTRIALEAKGYKVIVADTPAHAVELMEHNAKEVALVVTDIMMPQISGTRLAQMLRHRHPDLRILFVSGYTGESAFRSTVPDDRTAFLQKPYTSRALAQHIRELLDRGKEA